MDRRKKPVQDSDCSDDDGYDGGSEAAVPGGEHDREPDGVIRIAFTEKGAEEITEQQRAHSRRDAENVPYHRGRSRRKRGQ
jgi:hypothetical protein